MEQSIKHYRGGGLKHVLVDLNSRLLLQQTFGPHEGLLVAQ